MVYALPPALGARSAEPQWQDISQDPAPGVEPWKKTWFSMKKHGDSTEKHRGFPEIHEDLMEFVANLC